MLKLKKAFHIFTYILLFVLILVLADFYKQPLFIFLLMLLVILPPASFIVCKYAFQALNPFLKTGPTESETSENAENIEVHNMQIGLHNPTLFPLPDCRLSYRLSSSYYPCDILYQCDIPCYSRQDSSFEIPIHFQRCGCYQITVTALEIRDYLNFFHFRKTLSLQKEMVIYPKKAGNIDFESAIFGEGFDEYEETESKGLVSSNVTDIREYIPGDRLQKIHWKLSAKIDKLMVKENEQTSSNQFTILVELYLPEASSPVLENSLSNAYTMAMELLKAGEVFFFCYYCIHEEDFHRQLIHNREEFEEALPDCFYQTPYKEENLALSILEKTSAFKGTILHITDKGVNDIVS